MFDQRATANPNRPTSIYKPQRVSAELLLIVSAIFLLSKAVICIDRWKSLRILCVCGGGFLVAEALHYLGFAAVEGLQKLRTANFCGFSRFGQRIQLGLLR